MSTLLNQSISSNSIAFQNIASGLQGNILKSHGRDNAFHIFLKFKDKAKAKKLLKKVIIPKIISAKQQKINSDAFKQNPRKGFRRFLNFSLSHSGYNFLDIDSAKIPTDQSFRAGSKSQSGSLNDPSILNWQTEFQEDWHAILIIANSSLKILNKLTNSLKKKFTNDIVDFHIEVGAGIRNEAGNHVEHFGYVDGISQPHLLNDKVNSGSISTNNWNPTANLDLALVNDPGGTTTDSFGSYFIFRKLEQNVKKFREAEEKLAETLNISADFAGAQIVGRFRNGNPLIPVEPPQPQSSGKMNDFNYSSDTQSASKCPFHSHIRKTNPRGNGGAESPESEKLHLFPRRGITFGIDFTKSKNHPEKDVGLLFMAYNNNISNQFEFMQRNWANSKSFPFGKPNSPHGIDPIIGQGNDNTGQNHFKTWGDDASIERIKPSIGGFVTMKGGEYFFTPSISFLKSF